MRILQLGIVIRSSLSDLAGAERPETLLRTLEGTYTSINICFHAREGAKRWPAAVGLRRVQGKLKLRGLKGLCSCPSPCMSSQFVAKVRATNSAALEVAEVSSCLDASAEDEGGTFVAPT